MAFGAKGAPAAGPVENKSADLWTAERMANAAKAGEAAEAAHAEADRLQNGGQ